MRFDNIIQAGVWVGSVEQIECIKQTVRDANFEGFGSCPEYLDTVDALHCEETTEGDRGPIAFEAWELYAPMFAAQWDKVHRP